MENTSKQRNIVNNARWLYISLADSASKSMRLWRANRKEQRLKVILGGKYLSILTNFETLPGSLRYVATITFPQFDPIADEVILRLGAETYTVAANTYQTEKQVMIALWEAAVKQTDFNISLDFVDEILYLYGYDNTLEFVDISLEVSGLTTSIVTQVVTTDVEVVESWNPMTLSEIYVLPPEIVRLREIKPKSILP